MIRTTCHRSLGLGTVLFASGVALFACSSAPNAPNLPSMPAAAPGTDAPQEDTSGRASKAGAADNGDPLSPTSVHLTYYGGPLLRNAKVVAVYWNAKVVSQDKLPAFYQWLVTSPYLGWQSEYNVTSPTAQTIGNGTYVKAVVDTKSSAATRLADPDVQKELLRMIDAGEVPAPDENTLYMMHFPPGVEIDLNGAVSCIQFCGYHGAIVHGAKNVYYSVVPDQGGACLGGCGDDPNPFNNLTAQASHEFIEAVTDPAGALATGAGTAPPRAWYDTVNGESSDICNGQQQKVGPYVVQKAWSNKLNACIAVP
jgi:hypothetical protein